MYTSPAVLTETPTSGRPVAPVYRTDQERPASEETWIAPFSSVAKQCICDVAREVVSERQARPKKPPFAEVYRSVQDLPASVERTMMP